jgi:hypothetical protein
MNGPFPTLDPPNLDLFGDAISSPAPVFGKSPAASPDGQPIVSSGPAPVHVSRFRSLDSAKAMPTDDTSGPLFTALSPSAVLQQSLESRLRARMDVNGSPECALTWRALDMPAGPPICQLAVSARRRSATGSGGSQWPTVRHGPAGASGTAEQIARTMEKTGYKGRLEEAIVAAQWPTPKMQDAKHATASPSEMARHDPALSSMLAAQWPTPTVNDSKNSAGPSQFERNSQALNVQLAASGPTPSGSTAQTEKRGAPNPEFACWLMGWPDALTYGALQAIQLFRKSRRSSSQPS